MANKRKIKPRSEILNQSTTNTNNFSLDYLENLLTQTISKNIVFTGDYIKIDNEFRRIVFNDLNQRDQVRYNTLLAQYTAWLNEQLYDTLNQNLQLLNEQTQTLSTMDEYKTVVNQLFRLQPLVRLIPFEELGFLENWAVILETVELKKDLIE